jgi:hypothetical protein
MHRVGVARKRSGSRPKVDLAELEREQRRSWRRRARERGAQLKERRARVVAYHEAGHAIVAAFLGIVPEQIGLEVATHFDAGAVVTPTILTASRTNRAIVLASGGLAEERASRIAARGVGSDEAQIAALALSPRTEAAARRRAGQLVAILWPFIEALVPVMLEYRHLAGETAVFMALEGVFGADEAARRSKLVPLSRAFARLQ